MHTQNKMFDVVSAGQINATILYTMYANRKLKVYVLLTMAGHNTKNMLQLRMPPWTSIQNRHK